MYFFGCFCSFKSKNLKTVEWFLCMRVERSTRYPPPLPPTVHSAWSWNPEWTKQSDNHEPDTPHLSGFRVSLAHSHKDSLPVLDVLFGVPLWLPCGQTNQWMLLLTVILLTHSSYSADTLSMCLFCGFFSPLCCWCIFANISIILMVLKRIFKKWNLWKLWWERGPPVTCPRIASSSTLILSVGREFLNLAGFYFLRRIIGNLLHFLLPYNCD